MNEMETAIGSGNHVVFDANDPNLVYINENEGHKFKFDKIFKPESS